MHTYLYVYIVYIVSQRERERYMTCMLHIYTHIRTRLINAMLKFNNSGRKRNSKT